MFNVLPDIFKKEIKSEYYLRRIIVSLLFVIFIQVAFLVFIFPSWLVSFYHQKEVSTEMNSQKSNAASKNINNILQTISLTNQNLGTIDHSFGYSSFLPIIEKIISDKTPAIALTEFVYNNSGATTTVPMTVSGIAKTREDLVGFVKTLDSENIFSNVVSPISDLAKDTNISFDINLDVTHNQ
jgi:hypothetical protein